MKTGLAFAASPFGMVDAVSPDGKVCTEARWSNDIFIQCNATAAMVYLYYGRREEGERAARTMLDTIFRGPHAMLWSQPCGLSGATGGTCHGHDYYDHMVVWSYPLAFAKEDIPAALRKRRTRFPHPRGCLGGPSAALRTFIVSKESLCKLGPLCFEPR